MGDGDPEGQWLARTAGVTVGVPLQRAPLVRTLDVRAGSVRAATLRVEV